MKRVLYISYDGMTDPLGQSQVIPYLQALSQKGFSFSILSFEKREVNKQRRIAIQALLDQAGIAWYPLTYSKRPPVLSTIYDLWRMKRKARQIVKREGAQLIHARSYLPAMVARWLKQELGIPFLFDMRGFWADERVDGGLWSLRNPLYRMIYRYMKRQERLLLVSADHTISLTQVGKAIIQQRKDLNRQPIPVTVIPTCVDMDRFDPARVDEAQVKALKDELDISNDTFVLGYVGSTGTWYLLEEMLAFFKQLAAHQKAVFFFVTKDDPAAIYAKAEAQGIDRTQVIIRVAHYEDVPKMIAVFDVGIFFIKPVFSKAASAPTKMGELLAMGKPVICNDRVGDVGALIEQYDCGLSMNRLNGDSFENALGQLNKYLSMESSKYRDTALHYFSLEGGVQKYHEVYQELI